MIDEMVAVLKEQKNDDSKEEYCEKSLDQTDDRKKKAWSCLSPILVEALEAGIKVLGEAVSEAIEKTCWKI